jgi:hypothetical protein
VSASLSVLPSQARGFGWCCDIPQPLRFDDGFDLDPDEHIGTGQPTDGDQVFVGSGNIWSSP